MADALPPPIYSRQDPDETSLLEDDTDYPTTCPQILITPPADALNFQKGYLGADDEQAAIEGELQIKGINPDEWAKLTISLRTVEAAYQSEIELNSSEILLYSHSNTTLSTFPSSFPFSIPLSSDTPQSVDTPYSSLSHYLTATLHPMDPLLAPLSKTLTVHTRRYSGHTHTLSTSPETHVLEEPTRVEVEVPRTTFKAGEPVPVYVTIPPPTRDLVVDHGLRLRNVKTELIRVVEVKHSIGESNTAEPEVDTTREEGTEERVSIDDHLSETETSPADDNASSSKSPTSRLSLDSSIKTVVARSGASCRFHSSRLVKLRFVLHQPLSSNSPSNFPVNLPNREDGYFGNDAECPSVTQFTLLHSITFQLKVYISFVDISSRRERIVVLSIPITILAPSAPLPEVSQAIDAAYQKKHDRPPSKTIRQDDADPSIPHYSEGEAGPSILPNTAPPPFEERDAPPPFFLSETEASTSTRLPTFLESESEIIIPEVDSTYLMVHSPSPSIAGEGVEFGFLSSQQFDGHSQDMQRSSTPPPSLEMATRDTDITSFSELPETEHVMEVVGLAMEENGREERPPPPPPAMDDPSDPPPSIDSHFRLPEVTRQNPPHPSPPLRPSYLSGDSPRIHTPSPAPTPREPQLVLHGGHAPPPYLVPDNPSDQENVARPPPYMD